MRKIIKGLLALSVFSLLIFPINAKAAADNVYLVDDAQLLDPSEEAEITEYLGTLKDNKNYVVVTNETSFYGSSVDDILAQYYTQKYSKYSDGIAFIIDMSNREIYIEGFGEVQKKISDADCLDITDNAYRYASKGQYAKCIMTAMNQADTLVDGGFILRPMRIIAALLLSILLGFLGTFYMAMMERSKVDFGSSDVASNLLVTGAAIAGTAVIYDTQRIHRPQSSGSSGSGFSGGGGGGFSGGGGGGFSGGGFSGGGGHSGGGHSF